jgi:hypothetical protein
VTAPCDKQPQEPALQPLGLPSVTQGSKLTRDGTMTATRMRFAIAGCVIALLSLAGISTAGAATTSSTPNANHALAATQVTPHDTEVCAFEADAPEQVVNGGTVYGHGQNNSCRPLTPTECKLTVELFRQTPAGSGLFLMVKSAGGSWSTNCEIGATASYKCQGIIQKSNFYTQVTFTFILANGAVGTNSAASPVKQFWCD